MHTENSYNVILLYLIDIDFCHQIFIKNLAAKTSPSIENELSKIYIQKNQSQNNFIESLKSIRGSVTNNINRKFRIRLIYNNIFLPYKYNSINNCNDIFQMFACIENRIIDFLQSYFNAYPYTYMHSKELLDRVIEEKRQNIDMFNSYKGA